jgi:ankyrin repeat protein
VLGAAIHPNPLTTSDARNRTPASATQIIIIALLLANGARDNPSDSPMGSAVTAAAYLGYVDILKALIEAGCSANPPPGRFGTPIVAAAEADLCG